jgi:serine/threonine protein kinase
MAKTASLVKVRQRLGKYRIERRIAEGGFATVFRALDTIAGIPVALKIPHPGTITKATLEDFRKEVRVHAKLDHPNILPIKDADFVDDIFVIAYPLGKSTLAQRMRRRMSARTVVTLAEQMLAALAYAHRKRVMHCDVKPENFLLFEDEQLRLADFGIAKIAKRTLEASGSGTLGYIAPEQAMGKPSFRSDVFSLGLILYRMFAGHLPEWPFQWPPPGYERLRKNLHVDVIQFLRRSIAVDQKRRYADALKMEAAFQRVRPRALRARPTQKRKRRKLERPTSSWRTMRFHEFLKQYRRPLEVQGACHSCAGPVAESMQHCPWCGAERKVAQEEHRFKDTCPRCRRSLKTDWRFCPWCYGAAVNPASTKRYSDVRYTARCTNAKCTDKDIMPFMRYCPWCRKKVRRKWKLEGSKEKCVRCGWGVMAEFWDYCPWCGRRIEKR